MSLGTSVHLTCDWPRCCNSTWGMRYAGSAKFAQERARDAGWVRVAGMDFCAPSHAALVGAGGAHRPNLDTRRNRSAPPVVACSCGWADAVDRPLSPAYARERWRRHIAAVLVSP